MIAALFALIFSSATPSYSCSGAATKVELMICADPMLSRLDRAIAVAWKSKRRARGEILAQRQFLKTRDACTTVLCLRDLYIQTLPDRITGREPTGMNLFSRSNHGTLTLVELGDGWIAFSVNGMWPTASGSWNFAEDAGVVRLVNGRAMKVDSDSGCGVRLVRLAPRRWSITRTPNDYNNGCDGHNATISGTYR